MRRGFSLLEVMVTLGVVGLLAGTVFAFMLDLLRGRESIADATRDAVAAATIIERIEGDLLVGVAEAGGEAGVSGDAHRVKVRGRSVVLSADGLGDGVGSEFRFDERSGLIEGRLLAGGGAFEVVSDRVRACRFRYFDGRRWRQQFDSREAGSLPVAIEIAIWFGRVEAEEEDGLFDEGPSEAEMLEAAPAAAFVSMEDEPTLPSREPDVLRVMIVPDGPSAAWREGS